MEAREGGTDEVRRKERQGPRGRMGWGEEGRKKWKRGRGKGGGDLSLWSSGLATQESLRSRKERKCVPAGGLGYKPRGHHTQLAAMPPTFTGLGLLPHNGSPHLPQSGRLPFQLPAPPHPCSTTHALCAYSRFASLVCYGLL